LDLSPLTIDEKAERETNLLRHEQTDFRRPAFPTCDRMHTLTSPQVTLSKEVL
jgi:hypothetical protein